MFAHSLALNEWVRITYNVLRAFNSIIFFFGHHTLARNSLEQMRDEQTKKKKRM